MYCNTNSATTNITAIKAIMNQKKYIVTYFNCNFIVNLINDEHTTNT